MRPSLIPPAKRKIPVVLPQIIPKVTNDEMAEERVKDQREARMAMHRIFKRIYTEVLRPDQLSMVREIIKDALDSPLLKVANDDDDFYSEDEDPEDGNIRHRNF